MQNDKAGKEKHMTNKVWKLDDESLKGITGGLQKKELYLNKCLFCGSDKVTQQSTNKTPPADAYAVKYVICRHCHNRYYIIYHYDGSYSYKYAV